MRWKNSIKCPRRSVRVTRPKTHATSELAQWSQASTGTSPDTELTKNSLDSVTRFSGDSTLLGQTEIKEGGTPAQAGKTSENIDPSRTQVAQTVVTASSSQDSFELAPELETHLEAESRMSAQLQKRKQIRRQFK